MHTNALLAQRPPLFISSWTHFLLPLLLFHLSVISTYSFCPQTTHLLVPSLPPPSLSLWFKYTPPIGPGICHYSLYVLNINIPFVSSSVCFFPVFQLFFHLRDRLESKGTTLSCQFSEGCRRRTCRGYALTLRASVHTHTCAFNPRHQLIKSHIKQCYLSA